jgi:hypothetical protein
MMLHFRNAGRGSLPSDGLRPCIPKAQCLEASPEIGFQEVDGRPPCRRNLDLNAIFLRWIAATGQTVKAFLTFPNP